jgi:4-amino-4-deoxy-L-arabinose transferase-like glycosyltransferase
VAGGGRLTVQRFLTHPAAPIAVATVLRVGAAIALLAAPTAFALRDYGPGLEASSSWERIWHRPRYVQLAEDEVAYDALARHIVRGDGFLVDRGWMIAEPGEPTAYGGAAYPLFLSAAYAVSGSGYPVVLLLQIALSVLAVAGCGYLGRQVAGASAGQVAAWTAAVHPGLVLAPSLLLTEALTVPLIIGIVLSATLWLRTRRVSHALLLGVAVGVGGLVRSPLAFIGVTAAAAAVVAALRGAPRLSVRAVLPHVLAVILGAAVVVAPWAARNWVQYRHVVPFDTKSGPGLYQFNHSGQPIGWSAQEVAPDPPVTPLPGLNEAAAAAHYRKLALRYAGSEPLRFTANSAIRAVRFWWPVPRRVGTPVLWPGVLLYGVFSLLALVGVWLLLRSPGSATARWPLAAALLAGWLLAALSAAGLRHRLTLEPLLVLAASLAAVQIARAWVARTSTRPAP